MGCACGYPVAIRHMSAYSNQVYPYDRMPLRLDYTESSDPIDFRVGRTASARTTT